MAKKDKRVPVLFTGVVQTGSVAIVRTERGTLWLAHRNGEGMECGAETEKKFAATVERFFRKHF